MMHPGSGSLMQANPGSTGSNTRMLTRQPVCQKAQASSPGNLLVTITTIDAFTPGRTSP